MQTDSPNLRLKQALILSMGVFGVAVNLTAFGPLPNVGATVGTTNFVLILLAGLATFVSPWARRRVRGIMIACVYLLTGPDTINLLTSRSPGDEAWLFAVPVLSTLAVSVLAKHWREVAVHGVYMQVVFVIGAAITTTDPQLLIAASTASVVAVVGAGILAAMRIRTETSLREAHLEAERQRDRAEHAARAKSEFLASMSHEIRTPMNGVVGMADLLSDTPLNEEQTEYVATIRSSADTLLTIIDDILDLSKIEASGIELEAITFDPVRLAREAVAMVRPQIDAKGLAISVTAAAGVPAAVVGDPTRVRQILLNLLSNAAKFTEDGGITVRLSAPAPGRLRYDTEDTGIGIPADRLEAIFEAFTQADASTTRLHGGTGLGLSISSLLAARMRGHLTAESTLGGGSVFTLDIEAQATSSADLPASVPVQAPTKVSALRILVAEDNPVNQRVVVRLLGRIGYDDVSVVEDGEAALASLHEAANSGYPYDAVLMDVQMPTLDGLSATRSLRERLAPEHQPDVWMLTANAMEGDRDLALDAGADGYLTKPVNRADLAEALRGISAMCAADLESPGA